MFSLEELWVRLSTPEIGFYTSRRAEKIPPSPGIYAWFLPLWLRESPEELLNMARLVLCYDTASDGPGKWETTDAGFKWDPLGIRIVRQHEIRQSDAKEQLWRVLADAPAE